MEEKRLKQLFCKALASDHILGNDIIPTKQVKLRVIEEGHFRSFDLLIASIGHNQPDIQLNHCNILARTQLLQRFARSEKCRIDQIRFFPVEIKSDKDALDERLPNQILDAVLTFGLSILVLDKKHSDKAKKLGKFLPATIISYTGKEDYFEVSSRFERFVHSGILTMNRTTIARIVGKTSARTHNRLVVLQRILEKLAFNQLFLENSLDSEELQFLNAIVDIPMPTSPIKKLDLLVKESSNLKLSDYT